MRDIGVLLAAPMIRSAQNRFRYPPILAPDYGTADLHAKQVWVEPPSSALNMTLPTFADEHRRLQHGARSASAAIDRYILSTGYSAANTPAAIDAVDRWDRQTDGRSTVT